jgi:hypothetical protein
MIRSLSQRVLAIRWGDHAPFRLPEAVLMEPVTLEGALAFTRDHYTRIFGAIPNDSRFLSEPMTPAKARFLAESDRFAFRDGGEMIGLLVGNPVDWSTYYWRSVAFLPEHQGRGLLAAALEHTDAILRDAGVVRVEGEAAPTNYRQVRLLLRLGYCVTGTTNSERWGTMLRLTKFLRADAEERFATQFCRDRFPAKTSPSSPVTKGADHEEVCTRHTLKTSPAHRDVLRESGVFERRRS